MGYYPFAAVVVQRLVAYGFDESDSARLAEKLFLGPNASADELFSVICMVLTEKMRADSPGSDEVQWHPEATGRYRSVRPGRPSSMPPRSSSLLPPA